MNIGVIGAGSWGTTLADLLAKKRPCGHPLGLRTGPGGAYAPIPQKRSLSPRFHPG